MKYANKLMVVPFVNKLQDPEEKYLTDLDNEMSSILKNDKYSIEEKVKNYNKILSKFISKNSTEDIKVDYGPKVEIIKTDDLHVQERSRLDYGQRLASLIGLKKLTIKIANTLPLSKLTNNSFAQSYIYDKEIDVLTIHQKRLASSGDFGLVVIHALSPIVDALLVPRGDWVSVTPMLISLPPGESQNIEIVWRTDSASSSSGKPRTKNYRVDLFASGRSVALLNSSDVT